MARRAWFGEVFERGETGRGRFALTFDDGPIEGPTDAVLDVLKSLNATATFFVIGRFAEQSPHLIRRMHEDGHLIGNHTFDHSRLSMLRGPWYWQKQIEKTDAVIDKIIGRRPLLFRPPIGIRTPINCPQIRRAGHACVMWTAKANDGIAASKEEILTRLLATAADGDVLLLHDGREPASRRNPTPTINAIEPLVHAMRQRHLEPAPLDELLHLPAYAD